MFSTFSTSLKYSHQIMKKVDLVDSSCRSVHDHTASFKFVFDVEDNFVDFKILKNMVREVLDDLEGKNITAYKGIETTEDFLVWLHKEISKRTNSKFAIEIQETPKYGMIYDPN